MDWTVGAADSLNEQKIMNTDKRIMKFRSASQLAERSRSSAAIFGWLAVLMVLSACTTKPVSDSEQVVERAKARYEALLSGDLETAYTFYSPGYRSTISLIEFGVQFRTRRVYWTSAEYREHSCEGDRCSVWFDVDYRVQKPVPGLDSFDGSILIEDTWVKTGGEWWYLPKKS